MKELSNEQKDIKIKINNAKTNEERSKLQKLRNAKMKEINKRIGEIEETRIINEIETIENSKDDSYRMFNASKNLARKKPKESIVVDTREGKTSNDDEAIKIVTTFFEKTFNAENQKPIPRLTPTEMVNPFTDAEVEKAIKSLKNNKSTGCDNISAEQLKHGPYIINKHIADILNNIAKTGEYPIEMKKGILIPLPKPGKPKGPPGNLRLIKNMITSFCSMTHTSIERYVTSC